MASVAPEKPGVSTQNITPNDWIDDFSRYLFKTDVIKDHEKNYNGEIVQNIIADSNFNGTLASSFKAIKKYELAGRATDSSKEANKDDKEDLMNILFVRKPLNNLSSTTYNDFNVLGSAFPKEGSVAINGTPYIYQYKVFSRQTTKSIPDMKKFMFGSGMLGMSYSDKPFIKITDTTRGGEAFLEAWGSNVYQAITREVESDAAGKFNYTKGKDEYQDRFWIEEKKNNDEIVVYPPYTEANKYDPLAQFFCKYEVTLSHEGFTKKGRMNTELKWYDSVNDKLVLITDGEKKASKGKNNIFKVALQTIYDKIDKMVGKSIAYKTNLKKEAEKNLTEETTKSLFIGKHHGDIAQVLTKFRPFILTKAEGKGKGTRTIESSDYPFMFESYDVIPCLKAMTLGVDYILTYPTNEGSGKNLILFKLIKDEADFYEKLIDKKKKEIEGEFKIYETKVNDIAAKITDVNTKRTKFIDIAKNELNTIFGDGTYSVEKYRNLLRKGMQIADLSSYLPKNQLPEFKVSTEVTLDEKNKILGKNTTPNETSFNNLQEFLMKIRNEIFRIDKTKVLFDAPVYTGASGSETLIPIKMSKTFEVSGLLQKVKATVQDVFSLINHKFVDDTPVPANPNNFNNAFTEQKERKGQIVGKMSAEWGIDIIHYVFNALYGFEKLDESTENNIELANKELIIALRTYSNKVPPVKEDIDDLNEARTTYTTIINTYLPRKTIANQFIIKLLNLFNGAELKKKIYMKHIFTLCDIPYTVGPYSPVSASAASSAASAASAFGTGIRRRTRGGSRKQKKKSLNKTRRHIQKGGEGTQLQLMIEEQKQEEKLDENLIMLDIVEQMTKDMVKQFLAHFILENSQSDFETNLALTLFLPTDQEFERQQLGLTQSVTPTTPEQIYSEIEKQLEEIASIVEQAEESVRRNNAKTSTTLLQESLNKFKIVSELIHKLEKSSPEYEKAVDLFQETSRAFSSSLQESRELDERLARENGYKRQESLLAMNSPESIFQLGGNGSGADGSVAPVEEAAAEVFKESDAEYFTDIGAAVAASAVAASAVAASAVAASAVAASAVGAPHYYYIQYDSLSFYEGVITSLKGEVDRLSTRGWSPAGGLGFPTDRIYNILSKLIELENFVKEQYECDDENILNTRFDIKELIEEHTENTPVGTTINKGSKTSGSPSRYRLNYIDGNTTPLQKLLNEYNRVNNLINGGSAPKIDESKLIREMSRIQEIEDKKAFRRKLTFVTYTGLALVTAVATRVAYLKIFQTENSAPMGGRRLSLKQTRRRKQRKGCRRNTT